MRALRALVAVVLTIALASACSAAGNDNDSLKEVHRVTSGDLTIVVLAANPDVKQKDTLTIEFRDASGKLKDAGTVKATASMVMAGMGPMLGTVDVKKGETPGRYVMVTDLSMTGGWTISLDWDGPAGKGDVKFQQPVR
jgi:hypothetical protein